MSTAFEISYRLVGPGWAACDVTLGDRRASLTASYLSDPLGQLAAAIVMLWLGAPSARVSFCEEPGEYRWGFDWHRSPDGHVTSLRIRIWEFDQLWGYQPEDQGTKLFDEVIDAKAVYDAVLAALDQVWARHGDQGYKELWDQYDFPIAVHGELRRMRKR